MRSIRTVLLGLGLAACLALGAAPAISQQSGAAPQPTAAEALPVQGSAAAQVQVAAAAPFVPAMACRVQCPADPQVKSNVECRRVTQPVCSTAAQQMSSCRVDYLFASWCTSRQVATD